MKSSVSTLQTLAALTAVAAGCSQPTEPTRGGPPVGPTTAAPALQVRAGSDVWLPLPGSSLVLYGFADLPSAVGRYSWKKVSGPPSYSIESPESRHTKVTDLEEGTYEFEFAATDQGGSTGRDTVSIHVYEPRTGANEYIFRNVPWMCPMGCNATISNFPFPSKSPSKVLLETGDDAWIEVRPEAKWASADKYVYITGNNLLWIYTDDGLGAVSIRVIY